MIRYWPLILAGVVLFAILADRAWAYEQARTGGNLDVALCCQGGPEAAAPVGQVAEDGGASGVGNEPGRRAATSSAGGPALGATHSALTAERAVPLVMAYTAPVSSAPTAIGEQTSLAGSSSRTASIRAIRLVFGARAPAAIRVASCETGGTFYARSVGSQGERGLFQIHPIHFGWAQPWRLFDPVWNSRVAYRLSRGGTRWNAWSCGWAA